MSRARMGSLSCLRYVFSSYYEYFICILIGTRQGMVDLLASDADKGILDLL